MSSTLSGKAGRVMELLQEQKSVRLRCDNNCGNEASLMDARSEGTWFGCLNCAASVFKAVEMDKLKVIDIGLFENQLTSFLKGLRQKQSVELLMVDKLKKFVEEQRGSGLSPSEKKHLNHLENVLDPEDRIHGMDPDGEGRLMGFRRRR